RQGTIDEFRNAISLHGRIAKDQLEACNIGQAQLTVRDVLEHTTGKVVMVDLPAASYGRCEKASSHQGRVHPVGDESHFHEFLPTIGNYTFQVCDLFQVALVRRVVPYTSHPE